MKPSEKAVIDAAVELVRFSKTMNSGRAGMEDLRPLELAVRAMVDEQHQGLHRLGSDPPKAGE